MDINLFDVVSTTFGVDKSKKKNTDITDFTQIGLHGLFFFDIILPMNLGFCLDSEGFGALWCSLLPDEFVTLTMSSANHFSPLSFSPVGEMQVTQVLSKTGRCWLLLLMTTDDSQTAKGICPSPTGEDRWGLKFIG